jgi:hypothetical protein
VRLLGDGRKSLKSDGMKKKEKKALRPADDVGISSIPNPA